jgi:Cu/Ag efflux pump CusA
VVDRAEPVRARSGGFIALSGIALENGMVLVTAFDHYRWFAVEPDR